MAQKQMMSARNSRMETLEDRQFFSTYGTVNITPTAMNPAAWVDYTRNGAPETMNAGTFIWTRSGTDPGTYSNKAAASTIETFCIEPDQDLTTPTINYTVSDLTSAPPQGSPTGPLGTQKANAIRELWGRFHSSIGTDATKGAAFQMAIWELVCDSDRNLSTGSFEMDGTTAADVAIKAQAQAWLNQITGCGPKANLLALTSPTDQDQIFEVACTPCVPVCQHKCDTHDEYHCILKDFGNCLSKTNDTTTCLGGWNFGGTCPTFTIKAPSYDCTTLSLCGGRS